MQIPSISTILGVIFLAYIGHSIYSITLIFKAPKCTGSPCFRNFFAQKPKMQLLLFTSPTANPVSGDVTNVLTVRNFKYNEELQRDLGVRVPLKTRRNGTLFMHAVLALDDGKALEWKQLQRDGPTVIQRIALTEFVVPQAATFNLLGDDEASKKQKAKTPQVKPVTHIRKKLFLSALTDPQVEMSQDDIPPEMARLIRVSYKHEFLPIMQNDFLKTRVSDLEEVTKDTENVTLSFTYAPVSFGRLRFMLHIEHAMRTLLAMGFTNKDIDEVKSMLSDTNVYLLSGTMAIAAVHLLFDFLSFKNDVLFWKRKKNYAGLSTRTTLWRAFSQIVIFFYLLDENTSLLVLIPAGIGTLIELWKSKKILKLEVGFSGVRFRKDDEKTSESYTRQVDREGMKYLSYLLYPLCIGGAIYSLIYQPHKSWYSWTINSLVNGVYAFGFLFMLPQLFINYKLKSVAALPWRAFMYKAFNTFIDDIFAFIITMPTAHRVACFRDDVVFLIYLYQRWLYPVDKSRLDDGASIAEPEDEAAVDDKKTN